MKSEIWKSFDFEKINQLLEGFNLSTGFVTAILDLEGNVLSKSGWRRVCTEFHRTNTITAARCLVSDTLLAGKLAAGEKYHFYKCLNGLVDVAVPIVIKGQHAGNLFSGQFFFEPPDLNFFRKQAQKYGFNEKIYLEYIAEVPVVPQEKVVPTMEFLLNMTMLISEITYQKIESEELNLALKTSEQRWLFAIEGSELGLWDWDAQTNEVFYSAQWKRLLGFDDNEIGNSFGEWDKRVHPDDKEQVYIELNKHLEGKSPVYTSEHRLLCKDGSYKWILDRGKVMVRDTDNKPLRVIGTHTDITSLKIKEQQLIESERRFGKIFHNSPIGVNIVRLSNNTSVDINESYLNIIGYSRNEVIGKTAEELNLFVDFGTREKWQEELKRTGKIKNQLARFRSKSGEIKDVLASIEVIEIGGEKLSLIAAMDVTDQKKAEEKIKKLNEELEEKVNNRTFELSQNQAALINLVEDINEKSGQLEKYAGLLEAKNKELETFTYSVSHDLKAPLRGIDGYSKLLSDIYAGSLTDEAKHFINVIRNSTMQMGRLIDDLLNYSRLERSMFRKENIAMQSFVHAILTTYRKELEELHFETETSIPGITIEADSTGLSIILRNFIGNAIKFANTAENPKIEIALAEADDVWTISVKDNGIGFDMKYHDRIFDIFQRLHRAEDFPGTGVGLAMVSKAIARMGGKAWAKSTPGHGATFFVEIPKSFTYES